MDKSLASTVASRNYVRFYGWKNYLGILQISTPWTRRNNGFWEIMWGFWQQLCRIGILRLQREGKTEEGFTNNNNGRNGRQGRKGLQVKVLKME